jgi:hypothetical protein
VEAFGRVSLLLALMLSGLAARTQNLQDSPTQEEPKTGVITGYVECEWYLQTVFSIFQFARG